MGAIRGRETRKLFVYLFTCCNFMKIFQQTLRVVEYLFLSFFLSFGFAFLGLFFVICCYLVLHVFLVIFLSFYFLIWCGCLDPEPTWKVQKRYFCHHASHFFSVIFLSFFCCFFFAFFCTFCFFIPDREYFFLHFQDLESFFEFFCISQTKMKINIAKCKAT